MKMIDAECTCCEWQGQLPRTASCPKCGADVTIDDRPADDWCKAQGWEGVRDCQACRGSGERDGYGTFEMCPECGGDGIVDA